jgi:hypothetical protein
MPRSLLILGTLLLLTSAAAAPGASPAAQPAAQDPAARRVLDAYRAARPAEKDLGVFMLDWAGSLKEARTRAAREKRPIFFVSTTQLKDAGDLRGGHC